MVKVWVLSGLRDPPIEKSGLSEGFLSLPQARSAENLDSGRTYVNRLKFGLRFVCVAEVLYDLALKINMPLLPLVHFDDYLAPYFRFW